MQAQTLELIQQGKHKKGDVLGVARIAGIMATKRTADLVPMCHPLALTHVSVEFETDVDAVRDRMHRDRGNHWQDRGRNGGADRSAGDAADDLRHV